MAEVELNSQGRGKWACRRYWLVPALLAGGLFLINLPGTWIYDDVQVALGDKRLKDVRLWGQFFTDLYMQDAADNLWRPVTGLSFAIQWQMTGQRAWPMHLVNLLLHALVAAQVAELGRRLSGVRGVGLVAGLLFAAHPIHVDAVSMLVGRAEELCAAGVLGAMLVVIGRTLTGRRALAATACFLLAALSKEQGTLLPFMLVLWVAARQLEMARGRDRRASSPRGAFEVIGGGVPTVPVPSTFTEAAAVAPATGAKQAAALLAGLLTITLAGYIAIRNHYAPWYWERYFLDWTINPIVRAHGLDRALIPVAILGRYVALLFAPWRLSLDYSAMVFTPWQSPADPYLWFGGLVLLAYAAAIAWCLVLRRGVVLFCLACLGISYFLASNVIAIGTIFGERLMYLPSVFFCILAGWGLWQVRDGRWRTTVIAVIMLLFCVRTETYAWQWNDQLRLYEYSLKVQPRSSQLFLLLADKLHEHGRWEEAEQVMARARETVPGGWRVWSLSAQFAEARGNYAQAADWARKAFQIRPAGDTAQYQAELSERAATAKTATPPSATQPASQPVRQVPLIPMTK
jgi:hypothetical protein